MRKHFWKNNIFAFLGRNYPLILDIILLDVSASFPQFGIILGALHYSFMLLKLSDENYVFYLAHSMRTADLAVGFSKSLRFPVHLTTSNSQRKPQPCSFRNANSTTDSYILLVTFDDNEVHSLHKVIR